MLKTSDYAMILKNALNKQYSIIFGCSCEIKYSGRAESYLPEGDRIIIIKEDGTLLVHQPTGNNPVNYMKQGTEHILSHEKDSVVLKSRSAKEFMEIELKKIHFFNYLKLSDGQSILLKGTEKDMADMIINNPSLVEDGFKPLSMEEHTKYGFIDVFGYDKGKILTVVECKRYTADLAAVTQLRRYVEKIQESKGVKKVRGILAAPKISPNALKMLEDWGFSFKEIKPPKYLEEFDKSQQRLDYFGQK
ncbi:endonuclease NucS [Candidatus Woesearchaeota archaeon]|nr:endonuclease NucS [Candidatus Woesearchaeota archaeon]